MLFQVTLTAGQLDIIPLFAPERIVCFKEFFGAPARIIAPAIVPRSDQTPSGKKRPDAGAQFVKRRPFDRVT